MSCSQCELRRAKLLVNSRLTVGNFDLEEVLKEMEYRWPNRFYVEYEPGVSYRILQRNTVAPYEPSEVYVASVANDLKEIREFDKALREKGHQPPFRSTKLNVEFDNWVFTLNRKGDKIIAMRFDNPDWIEV